MGKRVASHPGSGVAAGSIHAVRRALAPLAESCQLNGMSDDLDALADVLAQHFGLGKTTKGPSPLSEVLARLHKKKLLKGANSGLEEAALLLQEYCSALHYGDELDEDEIEEAESLRAELYDALTEQFGS